MRKLSLILVIVGVLVILCPIAGKLYTQYRDDRMMEEWLSSQDVSTAETAAADPEEALNQLQDAFSSDGSGSNAQGGVPADARQTGQTENLAGTAGTTEQKVLGIIRIDKIKCKYPVVEGVRKDNLRAGIGHMPGTAGIGQPGNCALAGHRNYTFGSFFNRLDEVKAGDEIVLITKTCEYRYKVYEKLVVKPTDTSVIKGGKDDSILTLITCTPIYIATHRLILHARLESTVVTQP